LEAPLVVIAGATLLSACSGDGGGGPSAAGRQTTTLPAKPVTTAGGPAATSGSAGSAKTPTQPFVADTNPDQSTTIEGYPVLVSVSQGEHAGYRRYVFTFKHADPEGHQPWREFARPAWDVRYVPTSQAVSDGSGQPVVNAGNRYHLRILFHADMHDGDGHSTLAGSVGDDPPDMVFAGDFENQVTWFYGAEQQRPFRVEYVDAGRVAVDIVR
jgi:hypothetical protein